MKILISIMLCTSFIHAAEITIIGAGLSGLTCAHRLQQQGHTVAVFEALERPGGRILTHYTENSHEELGGKFISDGGPAVHLRGLLQELGLETDAHEVPHSKNYIQDGKSVSYYPLHEILPPANEQTQQALKAVAANCMRLSEVLDRFCEGQPLARHLIELRTRNYEGAGSADLSVLYLDLFWEYYERSANNLLLERQGARAFYDVASIKGGNSRLIHALCKAIGEEMIHYKMPLKKIGLQKDGKLLLQFESGEQRETNFLILTVPLPILKEIEIDEELLPLEQKIVLDNLPFGSNAKLIFPISVQGPVEPQFCYTQEGISWCNADYTLMTLYFGGEASQFTQESMQEVYRRELPSLKCHYPQIQFPSEDKIIGISWANERYFQGSYSHFGVEHYELLHETIDVEGIPVRKIFAPIQNTIFFAGEAAALDFPATMEGAVESADRISALVHKIVFARETRR